MSALSVLLEIVLAPQVLSREPMKFRAMISHYSFLEKIFSLFMLIKCKYFNGEAQDSLQSTAMILYYLKK